MFALHFPPKLKRHWVGPFSITKVVSSVVFWLDLLPGWQIDPIFYASNVKAHIQNPIFEWEVEASALELADRNPENKFQVILQHWVKGAQCQYLVFWKGYVLLEATY